MAPEELEEALLNPAMINQEKDGILRVEMEDGLKNPSHFYLDVQFLPQLSPQRLPWLFAILHLSSWKFPKEPLSGTLLSLGHEDFPLVNDQPCGDDDRLHLIFHRSPILPALSCQEAVDWQTNPKAITSSPELLFPSPLIPLDHREGYLSMKDQEDSLD